MIKILFVLCLVILFGFSNNLLGEDKDGKSSTIKKIKEREIRTRPMPEKEFEHSVNLLEVPPKIPEVGLDMPVETLDKETQSPSSRKRKDRPKSQFTPTLPPPTTLGPAKPFLKENSELP